MKRPLSAICLMIVGLMILSHILHPPEKRGYAEYEKESVILSGKVIKKEIKNNYLQITCNNLKISVSDDELLTNQQSNKTIALSRAKGVVCQFSQDDKEASKIKMGSYILVEGEIREYTSATNPGEFDLDFYYQCQKIDFMLKKTSLLGHSKEYDLIREWMEQMKGKAETIFDQVMDESTSSILKSMLLGDKTKLDPQIRNLYQNSGIAHILAISGLHIAMLGGLIHKGLRRLGCKNIVSVCISVSVIILYGIMTGMSVSAFRAILMFSLKLLATLFRKTYDSITAVSLAALWIAIDSPALFLTSGVQLSFGAVLGVSLLIPVFKGRRAKFLHGPVCIFLATFPIISFHYFTYPIFSVFINLMIVPVMGILLLLGLLTLGIGFFSIRIAMIPGKLVILILLMYEKTAKIVEMIPGNTWTVGRPDVWRIIIYYISLILLACTYKKIHFRISVIWIAATFCLVAMRCYGTAELNMLDVGQGDCIVMIDEKGQCITVDGGSTSEKEIAKYSLVPFLQYKGIDSISYAVITHLDEDHYSGILEILQNREYGIRIQNLVFSSAVRNNPECMEIYQEFMTLAQQNHVNVYYIKKGNLIEAKGITLSCLWPEDGRAYLDINATSVVFELSGKTFRGLLTGDISEKEEQEIIQNLSANEYTLLKAAHHGSKYSNSEAFLSAVNPKQIWISCGENNVYGHPHEEALKRMEQTNAKIYKTMESGAFSVKIK